MPGAGDPKNIAAALSNSQCQKGSKSHKLVTVTLEVQAVPGHPEKGSGKMCKPGPDDEEIAV